MFTHIEQDLENYVFVSDWQFSNMLIKPVKNR